MATTNEKNRFRKLTPSNGNTNGNGFTHQDAIDEDIDNAFDKNANADLIKLEFNENGQHLGCYNNGNPMDEKDREGFQELDADTKSDDACSKGSKGIGSKHKMGMICGTTGKEVTTSVGNNVAHQFVIDVPKLLSEEAPKNCWSGQWNGQPKWIAIEFSEWQHKPHGVYKQYSGGINYKFNLENMYRHIAFKYSNEIKKGKKIVIKFGDQEYTVGDHINDDAQTKKEFTIVAFTNREGNYGSYCADHDTGKNYKVWETKKGTVTKDPGNPERPEGIIHGEVRKFVIYSPNLNNFPEDKYVNHGKDKASVFRYYVNEFSKRVLKNVIYEDENIKFISGEGCEVRIESVTVCDCIGNYRLKMEMCENTSTDYNKQRVFKNPKSLCYKDEMFKPIRGGNFDEQALPSCLSAELHFEKGTQADTTQENKSSTKINKCLKRMLGCLHEAHSKSIIKTIKDEMGRLRKLRNVPVSQSKIVGAGAAELPTMSGSIDVASGGGSASNGTHAECPPHNIPKRNRRSIVPQHNRGHVTKQELMERIQQVGDKYIDEEDEETQKQIRKVYNCLSKLL